MDITFFPSTAALRTWLEHHHATARELWIGFYKKASGRGGITYPEALDQALCFGWIDGVRKSVDAISYVQRFSPRTATTSWSEVNLRRASDLAAQGLMAPAGLARFEPHQRQPEQAPPKSRPTRLHPSYERTFRARRPAWRFFESQPPGYRRLAILWVMSAVKEETRLRRLQALIQDSSKSRRLAVAGPSPKKTATPPLK